MRCIPFLFLVILFFDCTHLENKTATATDSSVFAAKTSRFVHSLGDSTLEQKITDTLMKIPFIQKRNAYFDSLSNHERGIAFVPDTTGGKIGILAGYNGPEHFETYYIFTIEPATLEIRIADPNTGNFISWNEYMKRNLQ